MNYKTFDFLSIFKLEKKPKKGLLAAEWVMVGYMAFTLLLMLFTYTKLENPESMLWPSTACCRAP